MADKLVAALGLACAPAGPLRRRAGKKRGGWYMVRHLPRVNRTRSWLSDGKRVSAEAIQSATKRSYNNMQGHG
jgi:uncharacterized protein (DUF2126 family)